jgi:hypothetical protein
VEARTLVSRAVEPLWPPRRNIVRDPQLNSTVAETMEPADSSMASPTGAGVGPITDQACANAQTAAKEINLHPRPPTS